MRGSSEPTSPVEAGAEELRLRRLFEDAPIGIFRTSFDGRLLTANAALARMFRYESPAEMCAAVTDVAAQIFVDPELRKGFLEQVLATRDFIHVENPYRRKDGTVFLSTLHLRAVRDDAGRPLALEGFVEDITERRRAEEEVRASEARYRLLFELELDAILLVEAEGGAIVEANRAASELLGHPREELLRLREAELAVPANEAPPLPAVAQDARAEHRWLRRRAGPPVLCEASSRSVEWRGRAYRLVALRDVTDAVRSRELTFRTARLESLAVLAGGIAHDFNNMLTGIEANLSLALDQTEEPARREVLGDALRAAGRARGLTKQLLTFSRGGAPVTRPSDLGEVVVQTAQFCARGWKGACRFQLAPGLWPAQADPEQVAQVIQNLVLNAIEAMPEGGVLSVRLGNAQLGAGNPEQLPAGPYLDLRIADEGPGIPEPIREHVFEPFFSTKRGGSGLGLAVCHSIVQKHGGRIDIEATGPGTGTAFRILLPAVPGCAVPAGPTREAPRQVQARVLLMDDEQAVRAACARLLSRLGCEVAATSDGREAVARYREALEEGRKYDLVILDLTVPGGQGGLETLGQLRALDPGVRAVVSSGYAEDAVVARAAEHGFAAVLSKPYGLAELRGVLGRVVDGAGRSGGGPVPR